MPTPQEIAEAIRQAQAEIDAENRASLATGASGADVVEPPPVTAGEYAKAAGAGVAQGATMGFADEIAGGAMSLAKGTPYAQERDSVRAKFDELRDRAPEAFIPGELVGGAATSLIPGARAGGTLAKLATGAGTGAVAGLGSSRADLTQGDVGQAVFDAALGAGAGTAMVPVVAGVGKVAQKLRGKGYAAQLAAREAAEVAARDADKVNFATFSGPRRQYAAESAAIERDVSRATGSPFAFEPDQYLADEGLAVARQAAWNSPRTATEVQGRDAARNRVALAAVEKWTDAIAARPGLIGKAGVANKLADTIEGAANKLHDDASAAYSAALDEANRLTGGARVVDVSSVKGALAEIQSEYQTLGKGVRRAVGDALSDIERIASANEKLSIADVNGLLKSWTGVAAGKRRIDNTLSPAEQKRIGAQVMGAIREALDAVPPESINGKAVKGFVDARRGFAEAMAETERIRIAPIEKLLAKNAVAGESAADTLLRMEASELQGVMTVVRKIDPQMARDVQAEAMERALTSGGKVARGAELSREAGTAPFQHGANAVFSSLKKNEQKLLAIMGDDKMARATLGRTMDLFQRLSFSAKIRGSSTVPTGEALLSDAAKAAASAVPGGSILARLKDFTAGSMGSNRAFSRLYSKPGAAELFNKALEAQLTGRIPKSPTLNAIFALADTIALETASRDRESMELSAAAYEQEQQQEQGQ